MGTTTTVLIVVIVAVLIVGTAGVGLVAARVSRLRNSGTAVLFRALPAGADRGWRHGIVRYDDHSMEYFRLSSLRAGPSRIMGRQSIEIRGRRCPEGSEHDVIDGLTVVEFDADGTSYEMAMTEDAVTAFRYWIESRPSVRSRRRRSA